MLKWTNITEIDTNSIPMLNYDELTFLSYIYYLKLNSANSKYLKDQIDHYRLTYYKQLPEQIEQIESDMRCLYNLFYQIDLNILKLILQTKTLALSKHDKGCFRLLGDDILFDTNQKQWHSLYLDLAIKLKIQDDYKSNITTQKSKIMKYFKSEKILVGVGSVFGILLIILASLALYYGTNILWKSPYFMNKTTVWKLPITFETRTWNTNKVDETIVPNNWWIYLLAGVIMILLACLLTWLYYLNVQQNEVELSQILLRKIMRKKRKHKTKSSSKKKFAKKNLEDFN